jgi:hypothetical protein
VDRYYIFGWLWLVLVVVVAFTFLTSLTSSDPYAFLGASKYVRDCTAWFKNDYQRQLGNDLSQALGCGTGIMHDGTRFQWFAWQTADGLPVLALDEQVTGNYVSDFRDRLDREWYAENFNGCEKPPLPFKSSIYRTYYHFKKEVGKSNRETLDGMIDVLFPFVRSLKVSVYWD